MIERQYFLPHIEEFLCLTVFQTGLLIRFLLTTDPDPAVYLQLRQISLIFSKKNSLLVLDPDPQPYSVNCDVFGFVFFGLC